MIGAKAGDRVVIAGADDADLAAEVARITGLNGQTTVVDPREDARAIVETAAANAGALVEFEAAPFGRLGIETGDRDVVVVQTPLAAASESDRSALLLEALRILRPGGRIIVIDGTRPAGLFAALKSKSPRLASLVVLNLLQTTGARAYRQLADTDGVAYYEARKGS